MRASAMRSRHFEVCGLLRRALAGAAGVAGVFVMLAGSFDGVSAASPVHLSPASSPATSSIELYVTTGGSTSGSCTKTAPCNSVGRAVTVANNEPFTDTPVVINVGKGKFVTHLNFPDQSYPEPKLTISGSARSETTLTAAGSGAVLVAYADAPMITVQFLQITGGTGVSAIGGGAVHDGGNFMSFLGVAFNSNADSVQPFGGGAIDDDGGDMQVTDSAFVGNTVTGGSAAGGGAIAQQGGILTITRSLFVSNRVEGAGHGGAISSDDGHLSVSDSTITRNAATGTATGGAIGIIENSTTSVTGSTINANTAGGDGGLVDASGSSSISFGGDILLANTGARSTVCSGGGVKDLGYNVIDTSTCSMGSLTKITTATAVGLQPLAANGGPTNTERLLKTSAAHDVVAKAAKLAGAQFCAGVDQRSVPRQQGAATKCDAGSYQFAPPVITSVTPSSGVPGTRVVIQGYGFVFLTLGFGASAPGFTVSKDVTVTTSVPKLSPGSVTIKLTNVDGVATKQFTVKTV